MTPEEYRERYGDGDGYGYGYGDGYGYGYGYGDGYGYGYGDGEKVATIASLDVIHRAPFAVVSVGCQHHTIAEWRECWRGVAERERVEVTQQQVDEILAMIE